MVFKEERQIVKINKYIILYQMVSKDTKKIKKGYIIRDRGEKTNIALTDGVGKAATDVALD